MRNISQYNRYTFRNEDQFIPFDFKQDFRQEVEFYLKNVTAVDGAFCDFSESVRGVLDRFWRVFSPRMCSLLFFLRHLHSARGIRRSERCFFSSLYLGTAPERRRPCRSTFNGTRSLFTR